jgi:tRNA G18 (ribose-2'-O)-methylase SpoU
LTDVARRSRAEPAAGIFIAEGDLVIRRALAAGCRLRSVLLAPQRWEALRPDLEGLPAPVLLAGPAVLTAVTGFVVHRGALASFHRPPARTAADVVAGAHSLAVLEGMNNPTNLGSVFRTAAALGVGGVLLDPRCYDPLYRRAVRVSMGAVLQVPWARLEPWPQSLDWLAAHGFTRIALTPDPAATALDAVDAVAVGRVALLLGAEGPGLTAAARARADLSVRIPMADGADSLNVGAAAAVAFYALGRPRP